MKPKAKQFAVTLGITLTVVVGAAAVWSIQNPWSRFNCTENYVDVTAGRAKSERFLLYMKIRESVRETAYSRVWKELFGGYPEADWKIESKLRGFCPHNSPNYGYHGAFLWQDAVVACLETGKFGEKDKRLILQSFSTLLRSHPLAAQNYSEECLAFASNGHADPSFTNVPLWLLNSQTFLTNR